MTRRTFVKSGACAVVALGAIPRFLVRAARASETRARVLVAIFQRGAVDGLSMVPPHGDPAYLAARPVIGLQPPRRGENERAVDLDGFFALHPALAPLVPLWNDRALAVVPACGSPSTTRSHFDAQDYMETGTPGVKRTADGWLGRSLVAAGARDPHGTAAEGRRGSPLRAVAIGTRVPRILRGEPSVVAMPSIDGFDIRAESADTQHAFESLYSGAGAGALGTTATKTFEAVKMLRASDAARVPPANGAEYPRSRFGESMRHVARLVRADVGLEVAFVDVQGWDTHVGQGNERGQLALRLGDFAAALGAFTRDLGDRMADVVVLTMSEFGRTVAENGNRGTDHGHATAMLVLGGGVRGGQVYGRWPGLAKEQLHERRDLALTTDFRTLFSEVATRHLGVPAAAPIFPGWSPDAPLGVLGS